jgi:ATP-dependent Clp protease ATP-binding subunit ClpA
VVFFAQEEAARLGENYVSPEHLLLGLTREDDSVAARILDRLGVPQKRVREEIEQHVSRGEVNLGQDMQLTPLAKRVIDCAYEEMRRMSEQYIGTEYLLLGVIRVEESMASKVLVKLGADLDRARRAILEMLGLDEELAARRDPNWAVPPEARQSAAPLASPGQRTVEVHGPHYSEAIRAVIEAAREEAKRFGENFVGTEHLLLSLIREENGATRVLDRLGIPPGRIRADIAGQVTRGHGNLGPDIALTPRSNRVLRLAYVAARQLQASSTDTEHLLLGLIREGEGLAARVLAKLGADLERTRREVWAMQLER